MDPLHADGRSIQRSLEEETLSPEDALGPLTRAAHAAPTLALRIDACRVLGALSGRAYQASWDVAERAAFSLLAIACEADAPAERVGLLHAMGRGFRNLWLMPYVHARLDPVMVGALSVEVPLRSVVNALRELQERRLTSLDSPASVTEWSRMMLFFAAITRPARRTSSR